MVDVKSVVAGVAGGAICCSALPSASKSGVRHRLKLDGSDHRIVGHRNGGHESDLGVVKAIRIVSRRQREKVRDVDDLAAVRDVGAMGDRNPARQRADDSKSC